MRQALASDLSDRVEVTTLSCLYQTSAARGRLLHLEDLADDPTGDNSTNRLRFLQGTDPSLEQLSKKENHLLSAVIKKETELREVHSVFKLVDDLVTQSTSKTSEER